MVKTLDRTFLALTDETRRSVMLMLADKGPQSISSLHDVNKNISRQAFDKHIALLVKARLISKSKQGREAVIRLEPSPLMDAALWMKQYERFWDHKLEDLGDYLNNRPKKRR